MVPFRALYLQPKILDAINWNDNRFILSTKFLSRHYVVQQIVWQILSVRNLNPWFL